MIDRDKEEFQKAMASVGIAFDKEITKGHLKVYFEALSEYSIDQVKRALSACLKSCRFFPRPVDIIDAIAEAERPVNAIDANEAWSLALQAQDETKTVVWTELIARCWGIALPILEAGDKVGARMAFIEAYKKGDDNGKWIASLGTDLNDRALTIQDAIDRKLLPQSQEFLLPAPPPRLMENERARAEIAKLKDMLV
jgi:hypothetical protein